MIDLVGSVPCVVASASRALSLQVFELGPSLTWVVRCAFRLRGATRSRSRISRASSCSTTASRACERRLAKVSRTMPRSAQPQPSPDKSAHSVQPSTLATHCAAPDTRQH
eukprot:3441834-Rhodomonas_salina.2